MVSAGSHQQCAADQPQQQPAAYKHVMSNKVHMQDSGSLTISAEAGPHLNNAEALDAGASCRLCLESSQQMLPLCQTCTIGLESSNSKACSTSKLPVFYEMLWLSTHCFASQTGKYKRKLACFHRQHCSLGTCLPIVFACCTATNLPSC